MDEPRRDVFFELHRDLPRQGPGDDASTLRALELAAVGDAPRAIDLGCGPGAQSIVLARSGASVLAVDNHPPFLETVRRRAEAEDLADRIRILCADMGRLDDLPQFDLVWSEGAIYILGFDRGLEAWRGLVRPGGALAVSEVTWLRDDPPPPLREFWDAAYPAMRDTAGNLAAIAARGYEPLGHFALPATSWWDEYYTPLERRRIELEEKYGDAPAARVVLEETRAEIETFRRYHRWYGTVFYVMRRSSG